MLLVKLYWEFNCGVDLTLYDKSKAVRREDVFWDDMSAGDVLLVKTNNGL